MPAWTVAELDRLRLRWTEGVTPECIARELGRSMSAVYSRAIILDLPQRPRANAARPKAKAVNASVFDQTVEQPRLINNLAEDRFAKAMAGRRYDDDPRAPTPRDAAI